MTSKELAKIAYNALDDKKGVNITIIDISEISIIADYFIIAGGTNENQVKAELVEKDGHYSIKTNVYEFLKDFRTGIINSDILGYAFEPEQRFEDPDGSTIIFDQDYLGEHRGVAAMPGPFADGAEAEKILW